MKAVVMRSFGGPEVMAAGVNFMDTGVRRGIAGQPTLPMTPGVEGAGVVQAVGPGVVDVRPGDRVAWYYIGGSYAKQLLARVSQLVLLPEPISFDQAASLMMQGLTASNLVSDVYAIKPGDVALVHAAAGGVGLLLVQMIKRLGGRVIGRVSHADKVDVVLQAGADYAVIGRAGNIAGQVLRLTEGRLLDVVYDGTGAEGFEESVRLLEHFGTLALYGPLMDPIAPVDIFSLPRSIKLTYPVVMHHVRTREALLERTRQLFDAVTTGQLRVTIGKRYPLSQAAQAHRDLESRHSTGKLIIRPQADERVVV